MRTIHRIALTVNGRAAIALPRRMTNLRRLMGYPVPRITLGHSVRWTTVSTSGSSSRQRAPATVRVAVSNLRSQEYSAVVIDQLLPDAEPDESDQILQHLGTAIPVYVNCAISGI